jgi:hypothetical protein
MNGRRTQQDIRPVIGLGQTSIVMGRTARRVLAAAQPQRGVRSNALCASSPRVSPGPDQAFAAIVDRLLRPANPWDDLTKNLRATRP